MRPFLAMLVLVCLSVGGCGKGDEPIKKIEVKKDRLPPVKGK